MRSLLAVVVLAACAPDGTREPDGSAPSGPAGAEPARAREYFQYDAPDLDLIILAQHGSGMLLPDVEVLVDVLDARGVDYHIGVLHPDYVQDPGVFGVLESLGPHRWVDSSQPDAVERLRTRLEQLNPFRSSEECGILATARALSNSTQGGPTAGFLREGSAFAVLAYDHMEDLSPERGLSIQEFVDVLRELRPDPGEVAFHSVSRVAEDAHDPIRQVVGGIRWTSWGMSLAPLFTAIANSVPPTNAFELDGSPDPETLRVHVIQPDGSEAVLSADEVRYLPWSNTIDLDDFVPQDAASIQVEYTPL